MDHRPLLLLSLSLILILEMETATCQTEVSLNVSSVSSSSSFYIQPKVVGGYAVTINQVPYQVSIRRRSIHEKQYGMGHVCGGTIISQRVVCSAAHCFAINSTGLPLEYREPELFVVVAGSSAIDQTDRFTTEYLVRRIVGHKQYNSSTLENDIALLFIDGYIPWDSPGARALELATESPVEGTICLIHGWGKINANDKSSTLQQAPVPILRKSLCNIIYKLPESQLCAGFLQGGIDACQGDSGGPLVCSGRLAGIISWGVGCADPGYPGVYTNVTHFLDWIRIANSSLDYSDYGDRSIHNCGTCFWTCPAFWLLVTSLTILWKLFNGL
ncbi:trypsin eta isoform X2 [Drosophila bipectinata]|uniref:trypsin eta isoform X2 n=1 Tax=Drosophila bipectinata TaxID=42026 RepID=UPI001C8AFF8C|nr:trypsin eta [Drosophila bipectinata]